MDLFSNSELYQVFNFYRHPDRARGEKVLRTFGSMEHCKNYIQKYKGEGGEWLKTEPYNSDEWENPKFYECCILPLEKFDN